MKNLLRYSIIVAGIVLLGLGITYAVQQLRPVAKVIPTTRVQRGTLSVDAHTNGIFNLIRFLRILL